MRIPAAKLSDHALDWAVSKCVAWNIGVEFDEFGIPYRDKKLFRPSRNWAHAGPIIERETITLDYWSGRWHAFIYYQKGDPYECSAKSPLVAAMRVWVATQLGDEVEIPDELLEKA